MSKYDEMMRYRTDGMEYALKIAKEQGIDALEKEVRFRNQSGISLKMTTAELDAASDKIKQRTIETVLIMAIAVLHDEFDFGPKRCQRFMDRANVKADGLLDDMVTWDDYRQAIKDELGIDVRIGH